MAESALKAQEGGYILSSKAVFLDRDGTLNEDPGYLSHPEQMKLLPTVGEALRLLEDAGFTLVIVSNQSGVGRGIFPESMLKSIHARLNELLAPYGVNIEHFYYCTHRPDENCACRKPKSLLVEKAIRELLISAQESYMIGDKLSDLEVGKNAKLRGSLLVRTGTGIETEKMMPPGLPLHVGDDLLSCVRWLLALI